MPDIDNVSLIRDGLHAFIKDNAAGSDGCLNLDSSILQYICSIIEDFSSNDFDVDALKETCDAYIPPLRSIPKHLLTEWGLRMHEILTQSNETDRVTGKSDVSLHGLTFPLSCEPTPTNKLSKPLGDDKGHNSSSQSEPSTSSSTAFITSLEELFPQVSNDQIRRCVTQCNGNLDRAVELLLEENGSVKKKANKSSSKRKDKVEQTCLSDEEKMVMFERYGLLKDAPKKPAPPVTSTIPYLAQKKDAKPSAVRYLDGKVVDTKGKNYIEIKPEYPDMPQPSFLKALRRYKFH